MPRIDHKPANATDGVADIETTVVGGTVTVIDSGGSISVDDNGGSLTVDDGGTTLSVDDGGGSLTVDGTVDVGNPEDIASEINTSLDLQKTVDGNRDHILTSDTRLQETLDEILKQLRIMNFHLLLITDTHIREQDLPDN